LVASAVVSELEQADRSVEWLSASTGIDREVLASKLHLHEDFTMADLSDIATALGISVSALAPSPRPPSR
jgi:hypothetical protein